MADKVQLIKEEIERIRVKEDNSITPDQAKHHTHYHVGRRELCDTLLQFIGSLPEEPKKQPKFRVGDTIKGPCNNVFQVKEVLDTQYLLHSENGDELNSIEIVDKYSCISEEPASEDLEDAARYYLLNNHISPLNDILHQADLKVEMQYHKDIENAFKAGAEWQKKHIMRDTINGIMDCDDDNEWIEITDKLIVTPSKAGKKVKFIVVKEE